DEIGSSLGTISFIGYEISKDGISGSKLKDLGIELNSISKSTADSMRDIIWFINPQNDSFEKLVKHMNEYASRVLFQKELSFNTHFSETIHDIHLSVKRNFFLIFKETITNIMKHSNASTVSVLLSGNTRELSMKITDNGVGFDTSKEYTGMGMNSISKRVAEINGQLEIESKQDKGTTTKLTIYLWKKLPKSS
nr:ATP-binding protein [Prolixibacteraceae bacterium]